LGVPLQKPLPLSLLAEWVGGKVVGDGQTLITGVSEVEQAREGDLVFAWTKTFAEQAFASAASAVVTSPTFQRAEKPCLLVDNPRLAMALLLERLFPAPAFPAFVSPKASIADGVQLGEGVFVGDFAVIGEGSSSATARSFSLTLTSVGMWSSGCTVASIPLRFCTMAFLWAIASSSMRVLSSGGKGLGSFGTASAIGASRKSARSFWKTKWKSGRTLALIGRLWARRASGGGRRLTT